MIIQGNCIEELKKLESESVDCIITSPPYYGLRDYGDKDQIGLEESPYAYISKLLEVFIEIKRILKNEGTVWLNLGDSYAGGMSRGHSDLSDKQSSNQGSVFAKGMGPKIPMGLKPKDLIGIPWQVAFALQNAGWYLRQDIIWHKPAPMPESVKDRCTKSHEYIFLLTKSRSYYFDHESIQEYSKEESLKRMGRKWKGDKRRGMPDNMADQSFKYFGHGALEKRNKRSVWKVSPEPQKEAHFATFPKKLIEPCVLAGCPKDGIVLDPFFGSGTVGVVATELCRDFIGIELNPEYLEIAKKRLKNVQVDLISYSSKNLIKEMRGVN